MALHRQAYAPLRREAPFGSAMCCTAIFAVGRAYTAQKARGWIGKRESFLPSRDLLRASVRFDKRIYRLKGFNRGSGRIGATHRPSAIPTARRFRRLFPVQEGSRGTGRTVRRRARQVASWRLSARRKPGFFADSGASTPPPPRPARGGGG
ncbi:protein of unknown function (plasmid) [Candidatus Methylocalor cossyra]|uniref:Uncharacterized protein n=1 Tax=Candidatus Methylocalor cossyra TaxID=3108543 RepID=A0ABM9NNA2_9GAMM